MADKPLVFVSCGQVTQEEKLLGAAICGLVKQLTPFEPYFAEYQTSLDGLSKNILSALDKSIGLIAVLHPRGIVTFPDGKQHTRASVWVEQEIAIAAYFTQVAGRKLNIAAYQHNSVSREGMRDQLQLNPHTFSSSEDVLMHLGQVLPSWTTKQARAASDIEIQISFKVARKTQERHDYQLYVTLVNNATEIVERYHLDVLFPTDFLDPNINLQDEIHGRRTDKSRLFRIMREARGALFPGDPLRVMTLDYFVDQRLYMRRNGRFDDVMTTKLYVPGLQPQETEKSMQELQNF